MKLRFDAFELDLESATLLRSGERVDVATLPARVLVYLAANRPRVVLKAELAREIWGSLATDEASLHQAIRKARRAVGDDGRRQAVIQTVARRGYRFVADTGESGRAEHGSVESRYVGRRSLLDALERHVAELASGRGNLILLEGEAGIGKTRTVEALVDLAWRGGIATARGGADPPGGAPAYWAWNQALRSLGALRPMAELREAVPHLFSWPPAPEVAHREAERFRHFREVASRLGELARGGPIAIVLEDLHRGSASTWELLDFVASRTRQRPLLLVATYRPSELVADEPRRRIQERIVGARVGLPYTIEPLSAVETAYLVEQLAGHEIPAARIGDLWRHTSGVPFFATQLAQSLEAQTGSISSGQWAEAFEQSALDLLRSRLSALSEDARRVLSLASVYGTAFAASDLLGLAPGRASASALVEASTMHLVREAPPGSGSYLFAHSLVRDALYAGFMTLDEAACRAAHLRVAESLGPDRAAAAAHHLCAAGPLAGSARIARGVAMAAAEQRRVGDVEGAIATYEEAIEAIGAFAPRDDEARLEMLIAAGEVGVRGVERERARARLDEAVARAREIARPALFARAVLARVYRTEIVGLSDSHTVDLLAEALAMLGDASPALAAALRSRRAIELRYAPGGSAEALREVEEAIALARRSGDPGALAAALEDASLVRWSVEDPEAWLALNREIAAAAREGNDTELLFLGVKGIATAHLELGDRPAFDEEMERCEQIAEAHPSPLLRAVVSGLRGARAFLDGDLDAAERFAIEGASAGLDSVTPLAAGQLYYHRLETGRLAETLDAVRSFAAESPGIAIWPIASARALVACGRTNEARAALRSVGRLATIPKDRNWLSAVALFAESAVLLGDRDAMREAREALAPHARVNVVMGNGSLFAGQTAHYLGMLCTALGERREAKAYFDRALRMHRAMRSEPWCLRTQAEQLHLAASEADAPPDPSAAASTIERAEALGMVSCADRARAAIEGTGEGG